MFARKLDKSGKVKLADVDTNENSGMNRAEGEKRFAELAAELFELQELMFAAGQNGLLVILQGRDTSGKDGTLKAVAGAMNPAGVRIASFKVPTQEELSHDFLWRIHRETPGRGQVVFFNRSHYEDVLAVRVHNLVPEKVWRTRFNDINNFEKILTDADILVAKFFLHISKDEQKKRLLAREADPTKAWKLNPGDWAEREKWDEYTEAYEEALSRCADPDAPWYIVPGDHKWFRNLAIAEALVQTLRPHRKAWEDKLANVGAVQKKALDAMRAANKKA